jgi:small-conductance mechanosensitive channel
MELLYNQYFQVLLILIGAILLAKIIKEIVLVLLKRLTAKTQTDLDDVIIQIISKPLYSIILVAGLHYSIIMLDLLNNYTNIANKIFFVIYTLLVTSAIAKIITTLISEWLKVKKNFEAVPKLISKVINLAIYLTALIIILSYFGVEISPLIAGLGIGGLAVGLALQNTLANFFSGIHIISDEPIKLGDYIEIGTEVAGTVIDIGWRSTKIKTLSGDIIIMPNNTVSESIITNLSKNDQTVSAKILCGVDYSADMEQVEKITLELANNIQKNTQGAVEDYTPSFAFTQFADSNINFTVYLRAKTRMDRMKLQNIFMKALKKKFDEEKIEISWPVRKIYSME